MKKLTKGILAAIIAFLLVFCVTGCTAKKQTESKGEDTIEGTIKEYGLTVDYWKIDSDAHFAIYQDDVTDSYFSLTIMQDRNDSSLVIYLSQNFPAEDSANLWSRDTTNFDLDDKSKILGEIKEVLLSSGQHPRFVNNVLTLVTRVLW
jgi:ABC-type oligopeptide transport system substrate-binding subunit